MRRSRSSGRQGIKRDPSLPPLQKGGPLFRSPTKIGAPVTSPKLGGPLLFLDLFACYGIFRFPTMIRILGRYPTPHGQEFERAFIRARTEDSRKRALPRTTTNAV